MDKRLIEQSIKTKLMGQGIEASRKELGFKLHKSVHDKAFTIASIEAQSYIIPISLKPISYQHHLIRSDEALKEKENKSS